MSKQARYSFILILAMVVIGAFQTVIESSTVGASQLVEFLSLRIPMLIAGLVLAFVFRRNPYSTKAHLFLGILVVFYCSHGQWYRPFYELTFFLAMVFYTLLLYPPRHIFLPLLILGSMFFMAVYAYRFDEVVLNSSTTLVENYLSILSFMITVYGIYKIFSEERAFKEQALERFGLLGKHSATILHDLKSTIAIPRIYTELSEQALAKGDLERAKDMMNRSTQSLESMQTIIGQLNQMSKLTQFKSEVVPLGAVVEDVREVLQVRLLHVNFEVTGFSEVEASRSFVFSFVLNLILNSVENFESRKILKPKITIHLKSGGLLFQDNGGGYAPEILTKIEAGLQASSKAEASGLGLFLLRDGLRSRGGKVRFGNADEGVAIDIQF